MRFLLDEQLPPRLAKHLRRCGYDCVHVRDLDLKQADDGVIWRFAILERRIVIAKDKDYLQLASGSQFGGQLVWVNLGNCSTAAMLTSWDLCQSQIISDLSTGKRVAEWRS